MGEDRIGFPLQMEDSFPFLRVNSQIAVKAAAPYGKILFAQKMTGPLKVIKQIPGCLGRQMNACILLETTFMIVVHKNLHSGENACSKVDGLSVADCSQKVKQKQEAIKEGLN